MGDQSAQRTGPMERLVPQDSAYIKLKKMKPCKAPFLILGHSIIHTFRHSFHPSIHSPNKYSVARILCSAFILGAPKTYFYLSNLRTLCTGAVVELWKTMGKVLCVFSVTDSQGMSAYLTELCP